MTLLLSFLYSMLFSEGGRIDRKKMGYFLPSSSIPVLCLFTLPKAFEKGLILFTDSFPSCPRFEGYETDSQ